MSSLGSNRNGTSRSGCSRSTLTFAVCFLLGAFATTASAQRSPIPEEPGIENARGLNAAVLPLPGSLRLRSADIEREVMHLHDQIDSHSGFSLGWALVGAGAAVMAWTPIIALRRTILGLDTPYAATAFAAALGAVTLGAILEAIRRGTRRSLEREMETLQARRIYVDITLERAMATVSWRL